MDTDVLLLHLASFSIMLFGVAIHSMVIYLTRKKRTADNLAYALFIKISSVLSILDFMCGSIMLERTKSINGNFLFVFYGIISNFGPRVCSVLDALNGFFGDTTYALIPAGMVLRTAIAFDLNLRDRHVVVLMVLVVFFQLIVPVIQIRCYYPVEYFFGPNNTLNWTETDEQEGLSNSGFFQRIPTNWEGVFYTQIAPNRIYFYVPLTFLLAVVTFWRVSLYRSLMSSKTARIHRSFILLLFLEGISLAIAVAAAATLRTAAQSMMSRFTRFCFLSSVPIFQGLAMLCLVPYFRAELLLMLGKKRATEHSSNRSNSRVISSETLPSELVLHTQSTTDGCDHLDQPLFRSKSEMVLHDHVSTGRHIGIPLCCALSPIQPFAEDISCSSGTGDLSECHSNRVPN